MEKANVVKVVTGGVVGAVTAVSAWMFDQLGVLFYAILLLIAMMIMDYVTGMLASKKESLDHPDNPEYGWSSKKGAKGIFKKVGYMCIIIAAIVVDYILKYLATEIGIDVTVKAFFGILVTVWYLLNEILSIIENSGRMGAPIPSWLTKYIAVMKNQIDAKGEKGIGESGSEKSGDSTW